MLGRQFANPHVPATEHFSLCVKNNDTSKTANKKMVVLQAWHIFTRTRTIQSINQSVVL